MFDKPKVSVVIPCFNHEDYVTQSINSVLEQTYNNIELIVIDDGSSDKSVEILSNLAKLHKFTLITQKNMGICKTLNKAIEEYSSGKYLALLASDDYFHPEKIQKQVEELMSNKGSEFCYTQAFEFDSTTGKEIRVFPQKKFTGKVLNKIILRQPYAAGSLLFTKVLYDRVGGFDELLKYEDWDFSIRCAASTEFSAVYEPLFFYRSHPLNVTKTLDRRQIFQQKAKTLAKNYHLVTPSIWLGALAINFLYDHVLYKIKFLNLKGFLH